MIIAAGIWDQKYKRRKELKSDVIDVAFEVI
jgi:hypothetical protein